MSALGLSLIGRTRDYCKLSIWNRESSGAQLWSLQNVQSLLRSAAFGPWAVESPFGLGRVEIRCYMSAEGTSPSARSCP
jgi:hypothetical protein